jgi:signal transduction histidine kinase
MFYDCPRRPATVEPRQIFRYAGLIACLLVPLPAIVELWFTLAAAQRATGPARVAHSFLTSPVMICAIVLVLAFGFSAAFWWNTRSVGIGRATKIAVGLLAFQMTCSLALPGELAYIVALELPLMLPIRQALKWLVFQWLAIIAISAAAVAAGNFIPVDELAQAPLAVSFSGTILYMLAWQAFAFGGGYLAASESHNHRELARVNSELMATQSLLSDDTRLAERLRISRELHDVVGHHLAGLSINLQLASHLVEGRATEPVNEAHLVAKLLLAEVREVVDGLRDPRQADLRCAFELLRNGVAAPRIHLELPDDLDRVDPVCAHIFFRCVQEAITNAIKHAGAGNLWVKMKRTEAEWELLVRDDGQGTACILPGNGLKGMAERLQETGGLLNVESRQGEGFTLRASIPFKEEPA